jgi:putative endonuclease
LGYKIISRNWTCYAGEIDIIAIKNILVFVEVKSVSNENFLKPHELFHFQKRKKLIRAINLYLLKEKGDKERWRLDLICLVKSGMGYKISHYENVIDWQFPL